MDLEDARDRRASELSPTTDARAELRRKRASDARLRRAIRSAFAAADASADDDPPRLAAVKDARR